LGQPAKDRRQVVRVHPDVLAALPCPFASPVPRRASPLKTYAPLPDPFTEKFNSPPFFVDESESTCWIPHPGGRFGRKKRLEPFFHSPAWPLFRFRTRRGATFPPVRLFVFRCPTRVVCAIVAICGSDA